LPYKNWKCKHSQRAHRLSPCESAGSECDKIGVSYQAFRNQQNRCIRTVGSCLNNQLEDLYESDLEAEKAGRKGVQTPANPEDLTKVGTECVYNVGEYFVQNYGEFSHSNMRGESPSIRFESSRYQNSELLLNFAAEKLFNVVQLSSGAILNVTVANFDGFSAEGMLTTRIQNDGNVTSEFGVQVRVESLSKTSEDPGFRLRP